MSQQQCHNSSVTTTVSQQQCHNNSVTIAMSQQQCHNSSVTTTASQLKSFVFSGEKFKVTEMLQFLESATTTQLLSSGEFCKVNYDTTPFKISSANLSFYINNSKMPNFEL